MIEPTAPLLASRASVRRRRAALPFVFVALALPGVLRAQVTDPMSVPRYARAFEPSLSITFGPSSYGTRLLRAGGDSKYKPASSFVVSAWYDRPLTRRTGLLVGAGLAPVSGQHEDQPPPEPFSVTRGSLMIATADVGLAGRLKPSAPVFFMVGGGVLASTKGITGIKEIQPEKKLLEPHADFTIGVDGKRRSRWGWRILYVNRWAFPRDIGVPDIKATSSAHDWTFQVGARRLFGTPPLPGAGR